MLGLAKPSAPAGPLRHAVVSTFHRKGYETYGRPFLESFVRNWPDDVAMRLYAEDVVPEIVHPRIEVIDQRAALPALAAFKAAYGDDPHANGVDPRGRGEDYRWQAVRFSNKVFAVTDAIRRSIGNADQLIWLDADTVTHSPIPPAFLDRLAPRGGELSAYLNRLGYPECGWVGYNLRHPLLPAFADAFEDVYTSGAFLRLRESHDSYVFWQLMKRFVRERGAGWKPLGRRLALGHIFINSELGAYMDHMKGDRKAEGRSRAGDLKRARKEAWWRSAG